MFVEVKIILDVANHSFLEVLSSFSLG